MPRCEGGWVCWAPLLGLMLLAACGTGTPDAGSDGAVAGVGPTSGAAGETGAQDAWQVARMDPGTGVRSNAESEVRNPFRFGAARSAPESGPSGGEAQAPVIRGVPSDRDPVPPSWAAGSPGGTGDLALTFIGFVESPGIEGRVVVLTDGEIVYHGRVGDVIDGRYRIVGIGLESVDVVRVDGGGRETLRLQNNPSSAS